MDSPQTNFFHAFMNRHKMDILDFFRDHCELEDRNKIYSLSSVCRENIIAGGSLVNIIEYYNTKTKPLYVRDIDIFVLDNPHNRDGFHLANHYIESILEDTPNSPFSAVHTCDSTYIKNPLIEKVIELKYNHTSIPVNKSRFPLATKVQIIFTKYPNAESLVGHFDMRYCKVRVENMEKVILSENTFNDIISKTLVPQIPIDNITPERIKKFTKRGWNTEDPALLERIKDIMYASVKIVGIP